MLRAASAVNVLSPEQVSALERVGQSLDQTNFLSQVGVGSPTAQLMAGRGETLMSHFAREVGNAATGSSGLLGLAAGGPIGAVAGSFLSGPLGRAIQSMREAGISNIESLRTQVLLNPELFRVLMTKTTRQTEAPLLKKLADQLAKVLLVGGQQANRKAEQQARQVQPAPAPRVNGLVNHLMPPPAPTRLNSLMAP